MKSDLGHFFGLFGGSKTGGLEFSDFSPLFRSDLKKKKNVVGEVNKPCSSPPGCTDGFVGPRCAGELHARVRSEMGMGLSLIPDLTGRGHSDLLRLI